MNIAFGPFTTHVIDPPLLMKTEHKGDLRLGTCPTMVLLPSISFLIATASGSCEFPTSRSQVSSSSSSVILSISCCASFRKQLYNHLSYN